LFQFLPDSVSPKQPRAEAAVSLSPAAQALQSKGGGKAAKKEGRFAGSLEKALVAKGGKKNEKAEDGSAPAPAWTHKSRLKSFRVLENLLADLFGELVGQPLGRLAERQIDRLAARIDLKELLRRAKAAGLDGPALKSLLVPAAGVPAAGAPEKASEAAGSREVSATDKPAGLQERLFDLLKRLLEILDSDGSVIRLAESPAGKRPVAPAPAPASERKLVDAVPAGSPKVGEPDKTEPKARVVVLDLRKSTPEKERVHEHPGEAKSAVFRTGERNVPAEGQDRDLSILIRSHSQSQDRGTMPAAPAARPDRPAASFEQRFIPEVVKQTGIVLKNGGEGEIRLVLKPENLGSLRIRLSLGESSLEGRIVVDNNSVKELVESSLDNLKNALRMEGYQTANLEVSVGHRRSWHGGGEHADAPLSGWGGGGSEEFEKVMPVMLEMNPDYEMVNMFA
jgi:flagellar hook-length control protein FliK